MIVVDSSVWIDHARGNRTARVMQLATWLDEGRPVALTDIIYLELLRGARTDSELARTRLQFSRLRTLRLLAIDDFDFAAELYRRARRAGTTVRNMADCLIAVVCIREQVPLLHDDVDFDHLADVSELSVA